MLIGVGRLLSTDAAPVHGVVALTYRAAVPKGTVEPLAHAAVRFGCPA